MNKQAEIIKTLSDRQLLFHLYLTQLIILLITFILSYFLNGSILAVFEHISWNDGNAYMIGFGAGVLVVVFDLIMYKLLPSEYFDDGGINERIFMKRNPFHILFLAIIVGVSEELLFRGVIQNFLGWFWASFLFAIIHFRYLSHWFLSLNILVLSFFIGYIYAITDNLLAPIILHITVDFLLGLLLKFQKKREKEGVTNIAK